MFLFLSKLLPLFFYPLGLSSLLLLLALVMIWRRRSRLAMIPITSALLILFLGSNALISGALVSSLEWQNLPQELPQADAIVVLGGCTQSATYPRPWIEVTDAGDRVLYAAKLYRAGKAPKIILSGGRIEWLGKGPSEAADMTELIATMGVPTTAVLQDPSSLTTRENAVNVQQIMKAQGIQKILLVTSAMHMPRSLLIFQKLGITAIPAPTDFLTVQSKQSPTTAQVIINGFPDADPLRNTTRALKEYVGIVVYRLRGWA
jgi:uncharacterized SAM-binding protein YcdF (DUF218 family)